eukprot:TRINITY_DN7372_c0_g4_i2.p1 TRINITY_DN7372_c0_g4~~TRINITY_DN7372_c0_g4_i2.p1  ORF type:complete len:350 (-),score=139.02 TRINITY_DN7372_c0_g4_i2:58-1107(-)
MLSFDTAPPRRAVFNLSGRRRCSVEPGGAWASAPQPYLVMIGEGLDAAALITALTRMESPTAAGVSHLQQQQQQQQQQRRCCRGENGAAPQAEHSDCHHHHHHDHGHSQHCEPSSGAQKSAAAALPPRPADDRACGAQCQCSDAAAEPPPPPLPSAKDADAQQQRSDAAAPERAAAAAAATAAAAQLQQRARAVVEGLESRGMYQWLAGSDGRGAAAAAAAAAAVFRFAGQGLYGVRPAQLRARHGVDLDAVNAAIAQAINTAGGGFITTVEVPMASSYGQEAEPMASSYGQEAEHSAQAEEAGETVVALQWALGGETTLAMAWPGIVEHTLRIVKRDLSYITGCNCRA